MTVESEGMQHTDDATGVSAVAGLPVFTPRALAMKRTLDIVCGGVSLLLVAPFMLILAALVKLTSKGPALFRQDRVGRNGELFTILKFRTMEDGTDEAVRNDPDLWLEYVAHDHKLPTHLSRTTRIGRIMRKLSLDELPQLINVVRGDMSLVGIRPIEATQLELRPVDSQRLYGALRPGLTGLWQVEGRSTILHADRVALDNAYVLKWSVVGDVRLILRTPMAVVRMRYSV